jgi:hypothetical protein
VRPGVRLDPVDGGLVAIVVDECDPRADVLVEGGDTFGPEVLVELGGVADRADHRRGERVGGPIHARRRIEQSAGRGGVEDRRAHGVERAVADVE